MAQTSNQGIHVTLAQNNPESVVSFTGDDFLPLINDLRIQEGSFGLHKAPSPEIFYQFPASEGEHTYITGSADAWARRCHPVKEGIQHGYDLILRLDRDPDYLSAMRNTWRFFYDHYKPKVISANLEDAYAQSLDLLFQLAVPRGPREVPGIPFCVHVESGKAVLEVDCRKSPIPQIKNERLGKFRLEITIAEVEMPSGGKKHDVKICTLLDVQIVPVRKRDRRSEALLSQVLRLKTSLQEFMIASEMDDDLRASIIRHINLEQDSRY
jgi:hypothetical protein